MHGDDADVELVAPADEPAARVGRVRLGAVADGHGSVADSVLEVGDGDDWGREKQPPRIFRVIAVEAEQGMEVDRAAGLVFGGFAVGYAYRLNHAAAAGELDEVSFDRLLGAPPQLTCLVVPDHVGPVVIAVRQSG